MNANDVAKLFAGAIRLSAIPDERQGNFIAEMLAAKNADRAIDYEAAGRRFKGLTDAELSATWCDQICLAARDGEAARGMRQFLRDIESEMQLRGTPYPVDRVMAEFETLRRRAIALLDDPAAAEQISLSLAREAGELLT